MADLDDLDEPFEELSPGIKVVPVGASDRTIEKHFETGRLRVVQDKNDFFLPHVLDFVQGRKWGNLQPEYQRRLRWDDKKKSRLIESFIMNVPIPPVFLYEVELGRFEVMDGQQRLNAVVDFLTGRFSLSGLTIWPALNGRNYADLPPLIRRGLERAKLSAITLMSDSGGPGENSLDLRAQVFERLNTGGERLNPQELRNSLYSGAFNRLVIALSAHPDFTKAWDIPAHADNTLSDGKPSPELSDNTLFKRMSDVEIVLRFFAFKEPDKIAGSVRSMLDDAMKARVKCSDGDAEGLGAEFTSALSLATKVFGEQVFRLPPSADGKPYRLSRPLYDAEMVAFHLLSNRKEEILARASQIKSAVLNLADPHSATYALMVGRANTAATIAERIKLVTQAVTEAL
jgi:hypothetical protein